MNPTDSNELASAFFFSRPNERTYVLFPSLAQRLDLLKQLVRGSDTLIFVIAGKGMGKTSLLHIFLSDQTGKWRACLLTIPSTKKKGADPLSADFRKLKAFRFKEAHKSVLIIDDAHLLTIKEIRRLLQYTLAPNRRYGWEQLLFFCEPQAASALEDLFKNEPQIAFDSIYLAPFTLEETEAYLRHSLEATNYAGPFPFKTRDIKSLYQISGGVPGRINEHAQRLLMDRFSKKRLLHRVLEPGFYLRQPGFYWPAGTAAALVMGLLLFLINSMLSSPPLPPKTNPPAPLMVTQKIDRPPAGITFYQNPPRPPNSMHLILAKQPTTKRQKLGVHREVWLLDQVPSSYTIQIMGANYEDTLRRFINANPLNQPIAYYRTRLHDDDWYPLLYGIYENREEALAALKQLPPQLRASSPWLRRMSSIQSTIRESRDQ